MSASRSRPARSRWPRATRARRRPRRRQSSSGWRHLRRPGCWSGERHGGPGWGVRAAPGWSRAIDEERARIARDLHDDQAQLLAAAKIALDGPPDAARSIFKQVEDELRRKTREPRPTTLGNSSLDQEREREFGRRNRAGVTATLPHSGAAEKVSRPVQQLCFLVSREALSNVIRHARAKSVQVTIETSDASVRVSVADDGCGLSANQDEGIGLAGVRERLELMGGRLTLESHAGGTTVVADIPGSG